jgi:acetylornithine/N-succinyldiaminopimelate aminotransferase
VAINFQINIFKTMQLFDVYPLNNITPTKALGSKIWDQNGQEYLDFYGGHAVISIGHTHPYYVQAIENQLHNLAFYSNSVQIPIQKKLAQLLGEVSGYSDYELFLSNSGAEANENALKLASFHTGRKKVIAMDGAFHGRTAGAVAITDNPKIQAPINDTSHVTFVPQNDIDALENFIDNETCAVIIEGIQGVGGIKVVSNEYWQAARQLCDKTGTILISDSVQCGYGRTGKFFSHDWAGIKPDLITTAKGMANGFPIGGLLISPKFKASHGLLGTTFGGNHLACAAAVAVLEVIHQEKLIENARILGDYLMENCAKIPAIKAIRGRGLMIGLDFEAPISEIKDKLLFENHIFCGVAGKHTLRLLPSLAITKAECDVLLEALAKI